MTVAWLDDRAWCNPKLVNLSDRAHRVYVNSLSYSSGMHLRGALSPQQQRLVGATPAIRRELIQAGLWDELPDHIYIHDWYEHNAKRDERKAADRERKRAARAADNPKERPADSPADIPTDAPQDRTALKEVKEVKEEPNGSSGRPRNELWDALTEVFGEPTTETARTLRGKIVRSLRDAGATHGEVLARARSWPRHFENATLTEAALEKHWDRLGRKPLRVGT